MPQGKLKVKTKVPDGIKKKKNATKGPAISKRANRPVRPKKIKEKLKQVVTKNVNKTVEEEMRSRAYQGDPKKLSKAQEAVASYHKTQTPTNAS